MNPVRRLIRRFAAREIEPAELRAIAVGGTEIPLKLVRNPRARRYVLRLRPDRTARVTVPRGGSIADALRFAEGQRAWLERQWTKLAARAAKPTAWIEGTSILFRGIPTTLTVDAEKSAVRFADQIVPVPAASEDLRPWIERHLWKLAARELPPRVLELAAQHSLHVKRVTVRNQRSRWGSCSRRATISLNWRILQAPASVRDYLILHELMHLRQMNHSARFWREVEGVCPDYRTAEKWLTSHSHLIR